MVLTDFGLATFDGGDGAMTGPGTVLGSPQFVAPERAREGVSDARTDMWSLGATLFATVEGKSPYARSSAMATLSALATEPPDPMRRAGPLRPVLTGLLQRDPWRRLTAVEAEPLLRSAAASHDEPAGSGRSSAVAAVRSAGRAIASHPVEPVAPSDEPATPIPRPQRRRRRLIALGGAATALLVAGGVTLALVNRHDERTPPSGSGGGAPTSRPAAFACASLPPSSATPVVAVSPRPTRSTGCARVGPGTTIRPGSGSPRRWVGHAGPRAR